MSNLAIIGIIFLVLAIILGNILLLKHSANTKFSSHLSESKKNQKERQDETKPED